MKEIERPNGYGIIDTATGEIFSFWTWIIVVWAGISVVAIINAAEVRVFFSVCLCLCAAMCAVLLVVRARVAPKVETYQRWKQLLTDIECRRRTNQERARGEANDNIRKIRDNETNRKKADAARKYKALIVANNGLPIVQGSYGCKRGEQVVHFSDAVTLCEQRSDAGIKRWKEIDTGNLQITNKRLVFVGAEVNREIRIDGLASSTGYVNGVIIAQQDRVRPLCLKTDNGLLINVVIDAIMRNPHIKLLQPDAVVVPQSPPEVKSDVMDEFLDSLIASADELASRLEAIATNGLSKKAVSKLFEPGSLEECDEFAVSDAGVGICAAADLFRCFAKLGHGIDDLSGREGLCLLVALSRIFKGNRRIGRNEWKSVDFRKTLDKSFEPHVNRINDIFPIYGGGSNLVLCDILISNRQSNLSRSFASALYEWAKAVAGADGCISWEEGSWLGVVRSYARGDDAHTLQSAFSA